MFVGVLTHFLFFLHPATNRAGRVDESKLSALTAVRTTLHDRRRQLVGSIFVFHWPSDVKTINDSLFERRKMDCVDVGFSEYSWLDFENACPKI